MTDTVAKDLQLEKKEFSDLGRRSNIQVNLDANNVLDNFVIMTILALLT